MVKTQARVKTQDVRSLEFVDPSENHPKIEGEHNLILKKLRLTLKRD